MSHEYPNDIPELHNAEPETKIASEIEDLDKTKTPEETATELIASAEYFDDLLRKIAQIKKNDPDFCPEPMKKIIGEIDLLGKKALEIPDKSEGSLIMRITRRYGLRAKVREIASRLNRSGPVVINPPAPDYDVNSWGDRRVEKAKVVDFKFEDRSGVLHWAPKYSDGRIGEWTMESAGDYDDPRRLTRELRKRFGLEEKPRDY